MSERPLFELAPISAKRSDSFSYLQAFKINETLLDRIEDEAIALDTSKSHFLRSVLEHYFKLKDAGHL